ncbi:MAG: hypothetical protein M1834_005663 [Cirrosporium novae-zelandiae]|nr:MAG: hypothetical protein M1834_005663 [Cirrosporium novae-zelandiae]
MAPVSTDRPTLGCSGHRRNMSEQWPPAATLVDRQSSSVHKHRKSASTGGGRAWTEEEESYLIQTRQNKMPYKHIAAHLRKTELACRLHYHQMSYGSNNRRRRNSSISSNASSTYSFLQTRLEEHKTPDPQRGLSPIHSTPHTPASISPASRVNRTMSIPSSPPSGIHVPILPKPVAPSSHPHPYDLPPLQTQFQTKCSHRQTMQVDTSRLLQLYNAHRHNFWSSIAAAYGPPASPNTLERSFLSSNKQPSLLPSLFPRAGNDPPTPETSPRQMHGSLSTEYRPSHAERIVPPAIDGGYRGLGFCAVNTSPNSEVSSMGDRSEERKKGGMKIQALLSEDVRMDESPKAI